jgi:hypothetical protein
VERNPLILITAMFVGSLAQAEKYVCYQPQDQGGKKVAEVAIFATGNHGAATILYDLDKEHLGVYQVAYGQYTKSESPWQNGLPSGSFSFYYKGGDGPSIYPIECTVE